MTQRGYGRRNWEAPASCPPEIADAVERICGLWAERIERQRFARPSPPARGGDIRFDRTTRRCRAVQIVLMGLYGRQRLTEAELADAVEGYAASEWHAKNRAWRTLTDWLAPEREDELLRLVVDGRAARHKRELDGEARAARAPKPGALDAGKRLDAAAAAELAALEGIESDRLEGIEREVLAALRPSVVANLFSTAGRPPTLTTRNSAGLRGLVLARIKADLQRSGRGYNPPALGEVLPNVSKPGGSPPGSERDER